MENQVALLFAAFLLVWIGLFLYLFYLHGRINGLRREVERLRSERGGGRT